MSNLSRRSLVISAAVLPALAVPALASVIDNPYAWPAVGAVDPNPDAHLLDLLQQYEDASKEVSLRCKEFSLLDDKEIAARKAAEDARPEVLRIRDEDRMFLPEPYSNAWKVGKFYDAVDVEQLRKEKWSRVKNVTIEPTDLGAVVDFVKRHEFLYEEYTPALEARARADEIIQAHDHWYVSYKKPRGLRAADRRLNAAHNKQDKIRRKIATTKASTIAGLKAKAYCVKEFLDEGAEDHLGIAASIMRDLSAMA
jgi:hypothetical protein